MYGCIFHIWNSFFFIFFLGVWYFQSLRWHKCTRPNLLNQLNHSLVHLNHLGVGQLLLQFVHSLSRTSVHPYGSSPLHPFLTPKLPTIQSYSVPPTLLSPFPFKTGQKVKRIPELFTIKGKWLLLKDPPDILLTIYDDGGKR